MVRVSLEPQSRFVRPSTYDSCPYRCMKDPMNLCVAKDSGAQSICLPRILGRLLAWCEWRTQARLYPLGLCRYCARHLVCLQCHTPQPWQQPPELWSPTSLSAFRGQLENNCIPAHLSWNCSKIEVLLTQGVECALLLPHRCWFLCVFNTVQWAESTLGAPIQGEEWNCSMINT